MKKNSMSSASESNLLHRLVLFALLLFATCIFLPEPHGTAIARDNAIRAKNAYMQLAIESALQGIRQGDGGPFGCVIVKNGNVLSTGHNQVLKKHDPTCHGEMEAIRNACSDLGTHDLTGCELYTTGEPCPMCLAACIWANIAKVYYGCTIADNARIGFRDESMDRLFGGRRGLKNYLIELDRSACLKLFDKYVSLNPQRY